MIFEEKKIILKNGAEAIFKTPELDDAENMLDYIIQACDETDFLMRYADEWSKSPKSIEGERRWINNLRNDGNILSVACYIQGRIIGHCQLDFETNEKSRHRASIGIAIHREFWGLGIGSYMFERMINAAKSRGIEILELDFIEGNSRGRALYEKFGFRILAVKPNMFRLRDGSLHSEYYMQKRL